MKVVITGGAGSIGLASAKRMYDAGAKIMLVDLSEENLAAAQAGFDDVERVAVCQADVSDTAQTQNYVAKTVEKWGKFDVLFANAGFSGTSAPVTHYPDEIFDQVMAVNVRGPFLACKYALPEMNDGGSIIITSSIMGVTARPGSIAYIVSKHAVIGLMRGVAKESAPRNIRVNAVSPGLTETAMIAGYTDEQRTNMVRRFPLGRFAEPDEIANAGIYLISEKASFMTGEIMHVNGGSNFG